MRLFALLFAFLASLVALPAGAQIIDVPGRAPPPATTDARNLWILDLSSGGRVTVWLRPDVAPKMVSRIKTLTREKFYDGLTFHRVIEGFMAQGGDPAGDGTGGSKLPDVEKEFNYLPHVRGAVAAARAADENSANSQFYIMLAPRLALDKKYTVFGRVIDGMQYVDTIERGEPPANPTRILHAYIASDNPPPYRAEAPVAPLPASVAPLPAGPRRTPAPARK
ncbi:peptidylprolyl isomerase [Sphingomonas sp. VNH70]|uniref:peptidylprolyl isomerase n=1 Tax=Sphingomonas silueang TaxID=3156617 RepID=UPI0032B36E7F